MQINFLASHFSETGSRDVADTIYRLRQGKTGQQAGSDETQYVAHKHRLKTTEKEGEARNRGCGTRKVIETHCRYTKNTNDEKKITLNVCDQSQNSQQHLAFVNLDYYYLLGA